jgi:hypothetical protein
VTFNEKEYLVYRPPSFSLLLFPSSFFASVVPRRAPAINHGKLFCFSPIFQKSWKSPRFWRRPAPLGPQTKTEMATVKLCRRCCLPARLRPKRPIAQLFSAAIAYEEMRESKRDVIYALDENLTRVIPSPIKL